MIRGLIAGIIGLSLLEVVVSNRKGEAGRVGDLIGGVGTIISRWIDPDVPLVPQATGTLQWPWATS